MTLREVVSRAVALVSNLPTSEANVTEWTGYALDEGWSVWVVVQATEEALVEDEGDQDSDAATLTLEVIAGSASPAGRDQVHAEVREAMLRAPEFEWQGTTFPSPDLGSTPIFHAVSTYRVRL